MLAHTLLYLRLQMPPVELSKTEESLIHDVAESGRCASIAADDNERVRRTVTIAPGQPPILSFRYFEGVSQHRFSNTSLMLDDAGH